MSNNKKPSVRFRIRSLVEQSLSAIKGHKTNISSPGYRTLQSLADNLEGKQSPTQEGLSDPVSIRSGVGRIVELQLILSATSIIAQELLAEAKAQHLATTK